MNIPATEIHNPFATWNEKEVTRCDYCESETQGHNYCDNSCEENHLSDLHYAITSMLDVIEWKNESIVGAAQMLYNKAKELELYDAMSDIKEQAKENGIIILNK